MAIIIDGIVFDSIASAEIYLTGITTQRGASDGLPVTDNLTYNLDFGDSSTITTNSGIQAITSLNDTGNSFDTATESLEPQPNYTSSFNGRTAARFDGTDVLAGDQTASSYNYMVNGTGTTIFFVLDDIDISSGANFFGTQYGVTQGNFFIYYDTSGNLHIGVKSATTEEIVTTSTPFAGGGAVIIGISSASGTNNVQLWVNGSIDTQTTVTFLGTEVTNNSPSLGTISGFASNLSTFTIGQFLLYSDAKDSDDMSSIFTYLNDKWAVY